MTVRFRARLKGSAAAKSIYGGLLGLVTKVSPLLSTRLRFLISKGRWWNVRNPITFDERVSWLKVFVYNKSPLVKQCADKLRVRSYVAAMGLSEILNELYAVYDGVDSLDWGTLPQSFALKWSAGAGGVVICRDRTKLSTADASIALEQSNGGNAHLYSAELQYSGVQSKLLCERLISGNGDAPPTDYKFYCYNGQPKYVLVCSGRGTREGTAFCFYDMEWNRIHGLRKEGHEAPPEAVLPQPEGFREAQEFAARLSAPFPFVRVDLYLESGRTVFGELTFTPCGGVNSALTEFGDEFLGSELSWLFETVGE